MGAVTDSLAPLALPDADHARAWVETRSRDGLARARELVERLRAEPPADALATLQAWDEISRHLSNVAALGSLWANVHPQEEVRTSCEQAQVEVDRLATELRQDRALYDVFAALDPAGLDRDAARLLDKTLEDFRRAGVDRDDETRARLAWINERLTTLDPGLRPHHPRRRPHRAGGAGTARRAAPGLARRPSRRRRRPGHGDHRLPRLRAGADVRAGRRRTP